MLRWRGWRGYFGCLLRRRQERCPAEPPEGRHLPGGRRCANPWCLLRARRRGQGAAWRAFHSWIAQGSRLGSRRGKGLRSFTELRIRVELSEWALGPSRRAGWAPALNQTGRLTPRWLTDSFEKSLSHYLPFRGDVLRLAE